MFLTVAASIRPDSIETEGDCSASKEPRSEVEGESELCKMNVGCRMSIAFARASIRSLCQTVQSKILAPILRLSENRLNVISLFKTTVNPASAVRGVTTQARDTSRLPATQYYCTTSI
jgi:hypothetical protein